MFWNRNVCICLAVFAVLALGGGCDAAFAKTVRVASSDAFHTEVKSLGKGDTVLFAAGTYKDMQLKLSKDGVVVNAEGEVVFTGASSIRLTCSHAVVEGFVFRKLDTSVKGGILTSAKGTEKNRFSRITIDGSGSTPSEVDSKWVNLYGRQHEVSYCTFNDKRNMGCLLVVWLEEGIVPAHRICNNFFSRPYTITNDKGKPRNGQEAIRIGTSDFSLQEGRCLVRSNHFYRVNGERAEVISNKSCGNVYEGNLFEECDGSLTLRHGNRCVARGNYFLGGQGGVRIIGEDHLVERNTFVNLNGEGYKAAICLVEGEADAALNGYAPVKRAVIRNNAFKGCVSNIEENIGQRDTQNTAPVETVLENNISKNIPEYKEAMQAIREHAGVNATQDNAVLLQDVAVTLKHAVPGSQIIVRDGEYADVLLKWEGRGDVTVRPQTPGGVVITGASALKMYGEGLTVQGLHFDRCHASRGTILEFRNGDRLARNCRLTECVFTDCNPVRRDIAYSYVHLYGRNNRVDHCSFLGKKNLGVTLIVMLSHPECDDNHHQIDHNWFGPRPVYGSNGAETIRIGTSQQCMQNSRTELSHNLFERCNGEVEVISVKSSENVIRDNVLYECEGVLALRHGDRNQALNNLFIGHGKRNTGGIRIVGEDQVVRGNTFLSLAGERFFSALALMYGVPNSLPNRYMQVKRTVVENNRFEACKSIEFTTGEDFERTLPPVETCWKNNVQSPTQTTAEPSLARIREGRGASWYVAPEGNPAESRIIELADGLHTFSESLRITAPTILRAALGAHPEVVFAGNRPESMITLCDGGSLTVQGIVFDGRLTPGKSLARGIITTSEDMIEPYTLTVEDCTFRNCGESGFVPVRGYKGTFAETVTLRRCHFDALSGDAINFAGETEDKGRYNADDILIEDCTFRRILGIPVHIARNGSDESTAGPYVTVKGCTFDDCCNKVRGSVVKIIGAQVLTITHNRFVDSGRGGYSIRLDDAPWEKLSVGSNVFENSGKILSNRAL